jgi:carboxymethylenebutenolidase
VREVELDLGDELVRAEIHAPLGGEPGPAVVVIPDDDGLGPRISALAEDLARSGVLALVVDWLGEEGTADLEEAVERIALAVEHLRDDPGAAGPVGLVGFGVGGAVAVVAAPDAEVDAVLVFDGLPDPEMLDPEVPPVPLRVHLAERGPRGWTEVVRGGLGWLEAVATGLEVHLHDADEGWVLDGGASAGPAGGVWKQAVSWLRARLGAAAGATPPSRNGLR